MKLTKEQKEERLQRAIENDDILVINNKRYLNLERVSEENLEFYKNIPVNNLVMTRFGVFEKAYSLKHQQRLEHLVKNEISPKLSDISSYNNYCLIYADEKYQ